MVSHAKNKNKVSSVAVSHANPLRWRTCVEWGDCDVISVRTTCAVLSSVGCAVLSLSLWVGDWNWCGEIESCRCFGNTCEHDVGWPDDSQEMSVTSSTRMEPSNWVAELGYQVSDQPACVVAASPGRKDDEASPMADEKFSWLNVVTSNYLICQLTVQNVWRITSRGSSTKLDNRRKIQEPTSSLKNRARNWILPKWSKQSKMWLCEYCGVNETSQWAINSY